MDEDLLKKVLGLASSAGNKIKSGAKSLAGNTASFLRNLNEVTPQERNAGRNFFMKMGATPTGAPATESIKITDAIRQTSGGVAKDFGDFFRKNPIGGARTQPIFNMVGNTAETIGSGMSGGVMNVMDFVQSPTKTNFVKQGAGLVYNAAKPVAAATPFFQASNAATQLPQSGRFSFAPRVAAGMIRGQTGVNTLSPEVEARNTAKIGSFEFDPASIAGEMVGFVKNPVNSRIFKATEALDPKLIKNPVVNYILINGTRGALEDLAMSLKDLPDNASAEEIRNYLAQNAAFGAVAEVGVRGGSEVVQKGAKTLWEGLTTNFTPKQIVNALKEFRTKAPDRARSRIKPQSTETSAERARDILGRFSSSKGMPFEERIAMLSRSGKVNLADLSNRERKAVNEFRFKNDINPKRQSADFVQDPDNPTRWVRQEAPQTAAGGFFGAEMETDEEGRPTGKLTYDWEKGVLGMAGLTAANSRARKQLAENVLDVSTEEGFTLLARTIGEAQAKLFRDTGDFGRSDKSMVARALGVGDIVRGARETVQDVAESAGRQVDERLRPLMDATRQYKTPEEFASAHQANDLLDLSNPHQHRFGRLFEDGVNEDTNTYMDLPSIVKEYGQDIRYYPDANVPQVKSPEDMVTIYRGTVKEQGEILPGDFVTFNKEYALSHNNGENLLEMKVPAKDVVWQGNDFSEWVYSPEDLRGGREYTGGLQDFYRRATSGNEMMGVIPTFETDEEGNTKITGFVPVTAGMVRQADNALKSVDDVSKALDQYGTMKPKTELLRQAEELMAKGQQQWELNHADAQLAQATRGLFSNDMIGEINRLKQMARSKAFQEGDIETLRQRDGQLVDRVVEAVREARGDESIPDEEALRMALELPTRADTVVTTPDEIKEARDLIRQANELRDFVYNSETDPRVMDRIMKNNEKQIEKQAKAEFKQWEQEAWDSLEATYGKLRTKTQFLNDTVKNAADMIKNNTGSSGGRNVENLKDISGFNAQMRDVYRNFKAVYGDRFSEVKRTILDPFDRSKGEAIDFQRDMLKQLDENVVDGLGIKKNSAESAAVQEYGEGRRDFDSLVQEFGQAKAEQIAAADTFFRQTYDNLLDQINVIRARIYPDNPEKLIPKRNDYYRHFQDMGEGFQKLGNILTGDFNISSGLAGTSDFTQPKSQWQSIFQRRKGETAKMDAVGGFLDYLPAATQAIYYDPHISVFRGLADEIADQTAEGTPREGQLNNFIEFLRDYSNNLSGKTNAWDRPLQKLMGRKAFGAINWLNSRVKANVILGNLSSSVAQFGNVPQGVADAGVRNTAEGIVRSVRSLFDESAPIRQSDFVDERYFNDYAKFDPGMLNRTRDFAAWFTGALDEVGTHMIWNAEYSKALNEGVENPIKFADDVTRSLVAGRGKGEVPLLQESRAMQLVAPFQLEVANLWHVMKDWVDEKTFGKFVTFAVATYAFNRAAENIRGSDVSFDPINAMVDAYNAFAEEDDKSIGAVRAGGRLTGEVLSNMPFLQQVAAAYPEYGFTIADKKFPTREDFFGDGDPTRFGSGLLATSSISDPVFKIATPFGGQQIKKTLQGLTTFAKGYSETGSGRVRFPVDQTPGNLAKSALLGQYSTSNARDYFNNDRSTLGEKQSETFKALAGQGGNAANTFYNQTIQSRENNSAQGDVAGASTAQPGFWDRIFGGGQSDSVDEFAKIYEFEEYLGENTRKGIDKYEFEKEKADLAVKMYDGDGDFANMPEELRAEALQRMGYNEAQLMYASFAGKDSVPTAEYLMETYDAGEYEDRQMFVNSLLEGRVESIAGDMLVDNKVLDELYYAGYITKKERTALRKYYYDKEGNPKMGTPGTTGSGSSSASKKLQKEIKKVRDEANEALIKGLLNPPKVSQFTGKEQQSSSVKPVQVPVRNADEYQLFSSADRAEIPQVEPINWEQFFANRQPSLSMDKARQAVNSVRGGGNAYRKLSYSNAR